MECLRIKYSFVALAEIDSNSCSYSIVLIKKYVSLICYNKVKGVLSFKLSMKIKPNVNGN